MKQKEHDERLAVEIIKEHLKDKKNLQIKKDRHRTQDGEDPPDFYFEIGSDKIGCEVGHFDSIDQPTKGKGDNLLWQAGIRRKIVKCTAIGNLDHSLNQDYDTITLRLKGAIRWQNGEDSPLSLRQK